MPIGVNLSCQSAKSSRPPGTDRELIPCLIAKVLSKRTEELMSPLERTFALRQGFQPLSDYGLYLKLTRFGHCRFLTIASLQDALDAETTECGLIVPGNQQPQHPDYYFHSPCSVKAAQ